MPGAPQALGANREHQGNTSKELRCVLLRGWSGEQLRCLYYAGCVGSKQKLEVTTLLEHYDLVTVSETWRGKSHNLSLPTNGYRLSEETSEDEGWRSWSLNQKAD